jgi:hypothetical protein
MSRFSLRHVSLYLVRKITALLIMQFSYVPSPSLSLPNNQIISLTLCFLHLNLYFLLTARDQVSDSQILMHVRTRFTLYRSFFNAEMSTVEWVEGLSLLAVQR